MRVEVPLAGSQVFQTRARVLASERLNEEHWRLSLAAPEIAAAVRPGQFVNLRVGSLNDPVCRRPFSVFRTVRGDGGPLGVEVVYRVVGRGTRLMTTARAGDWFDLIGPLGNGYRRDESKRGQILVGGGCGAAALFMLGQEIAGAARAEKAAGHTQPELITVLGFRSRDLVMLEEEFGTLGGEVVLATDDGTCGRPGNAVSALRDVIDATGKGGDCAVYASGPEAMNRLVVEFCRERDISGQIAVEKHMLCGIGACLTCTCKVDKAGVLKHRDPAFSHIQFDADSDVGHALVCRDGPIFAVDEVVVE